MSTLVLLTRRNIRLFFKDLGMLLTSMITPLILLLLYITFLCNVYRDSFLLHFGGIAIEEGLINGLVGGQLFSSLLAVSCVTVAFCANLLMAQDKVTGARADLLVAPVKRHYLAIGYYAATLAVTLMIALVAACACFIYMAVEGWYLSVGDVALILLDILLLVMFGTAFSSVVNYFLATQGQISAVGSIVSSCYGFVCGAYMPISSFSEGLRNAVAFFPGTYATSLLRNHALAGALREMEEQNVPTAVIESIRDSVDCNLYFFGECVSEHMMYAILIGATLILFAAFVLINRFDRRKS